MLQFDMHQSTMLIGTPGSDQRQGNEGPGEDGNNGSHDQGENYCSALVLFLEVFILHTSATELLDLHIICNEVLFLYTWTNDMFHLDTSCLHMFYCNTLSHGLCV